jgi:hypothetical protein
VESLPKDWELKTSSLDKKLGMAVDSLGHVRALIKMPEEVEENNITILTMGRIYYV